MAPTRRKKPKREPQRPSVVKRGRAAAPAAEPTAAAQGAADEQVAAGARQSAGAAGLALFGALRLAWGRQAARILWRMLRRMRIFQL